MISRIQPRTSTRAIVICCAVWFLSMAAVALPSRSTALLGQDSDSTAASQDPADLISRETPIGNNPKIRPELNSETAWEYSPYNVVVWLVDDGSHIFQRLQPRIAQRITRDASLEDFNGWRVQCVQPNVVWNSRLGGNWETDLAEFAQPLCDDPSLRNADKLIVVRIRQTRDGFSLQVRELDLPTKYFGSVTEFAVAEADLIPARAYWGVKKSFAPLARIERVADEFAYVRTRAGALSRRLEIDSAGNISEVTNFDSPVWVRDNDILLPVIRREGRDNRAASAEPVEWTLLSIHERMGSTLKCMTHTAGFAPLAGRSGSMIKKYALVVRPDPNPTTLYITAQDSKNQATISGLEVYHLRPEEIKSKDLHLIGKTDWKGSITIPPAEDGSIRYIIVRNGAMMVKKPMLPGLFSTMTAAVPSDRARVFAEGVINGLRGEIIEWAALEATTKARIDIALEKKQFDKAAKIYNDEYLKLKTVRQITLRLTNVRERLISRKDADSRQRDRIEQMFASIDDSINRILTLRAERKKASNEVELETRVLNKISTPTASNPTGENPAADPEQALDPNKPQPVPPTNPSPESQEFD